MIDLAVVLGTPRFQEVFDAILDEVVVDGATIAHEALGHEPEQWVRSRIEEVEIVSHEDLKKELPSVSFVVRTGETTPYSNVIVRCGVPF